MKNHIFPIRLYPEDIKCRKALESTMRDINGRKMPFADILRLLMHEKLRSIRQRRSSGWSENVGTWNP